MARSSSSARSGSLGTPSKPKSVALGKDSSIQIRKISNGYIVRESSWDGKNFKEKETFTKAKPNLSIS